MAIGDSITEAVRRQKAVTDALRAAIAEQEAEEEEARRAQDSEAGEST